MKNTKRTEKPKTGWYASAGLIIGGLGYVTNFGLYSEVLMMVGAILLSVAFYADVIKKEKE